jgi:dTDP-4-amino-4,6-dideoxygalactose transaminase
MTELQAAMGLSVLPFMDFILEERKKVCDYYDEHLDFSKLKKMKLRPFTEWNHSYYPILFNTEEELLKAQTELNNKGIFPRRYFYPSLETLPYVKSSSCPVSNNIASRILCLPLYVGLSLDKLKVISETI